MKNHSDQRAGQRRSHANRREKTDIRYEDPYFHHKVERRTKNDRRQDQRRIDRKLLS